MKCGGCNNSIRVGCSYDVTKLQCPITGEVNGFFGECDITERQKLIWLLNRYEDIICEALAKKG